MKDRIEGWTQTDEDWTFGLNGYERCWRGDPPTLEEQRYLLQLYRAIADATQEAFAPPRWAPNTISPDTIRAAIDELLDDTDVPEGLAGAITIIK